MQMGMIFESEVSNDGIVKVLQHVQQYLPTVGKAGNCRRSADHRESC